MWTEDRPVFTGKHYQIDGPINQPRRKPQFWLGGGGEKVTLKLVAKYADGSNVGNGDAALIRQKLAVLRDHCDAVGRDYATIAKSTTIEVDPAWSTADAIARVEQVVEAGCDYVIFYIPRLAYDHEPLHRLAADLIPRFA
jgi:alkanesulfonate monooxygenase SsuD/methylene tetrahydromethanopterin reductase-like flavin-dependent oxidoreductase (luciferase family)